jgi:cytochrome c oxidase subunit 3
MWIFLATEVLFFGVLFTAYATFRMLYPGSFTEASHHLNQTLGAINTAVLLCSSLSVALSVHAAQTGNRKRLTALLLLTVVLGTVFLGIKAYEYYVDYHEGLIPGLNFTFASPEAPYVELFFFMYFVMTGIHAFHMIIGLVLFLVLAFFAWRGRYTPEKHMPVELCGLYWHFVDVVWVFLFPLLYLIG